LTFIQLPSLEQLEQIEQIKAKNIELLEFDKNKQFVRCQNCGLQYRIFQGQSNLRSSDSKRIKELKRKIQFQKTKAKFIKYYDKVEIVYPSTAEQQEDERELKGLLEEKERTELLTRLPLYATKMTGFKWVCPTCFNEFYLSNKQKI